MSDLSPRIAALRGAIAEKGPDAAASFWEQVAVEGTPLVEQIAGRAGGFVVTFLWRSAAAGSVAVVGGPMGAGPNRLHRLEGTDVWYRTHRVPSDARCTYMVVENPPEFPDDPDDRDEVIRTAMELYGRMLSDPMNPRTTLVFPEDEESPTGQAGSSSLLELPEAPLQQWAVRQEGVPAGKVDLHLFESRILGNRRRVWVYTPPGYGHGAPAAGAAVFLDGLLLASSVIDLPVILDNLIAAGKIPPVIAAMAGTPPPAMPTKMYENTCHPPFADFVAGELLPFLHQHYRFPQGPGTTIAGGMSLGGLAAAHAAFTRPDALGDLLCCSGSLWWGPPDGEPESLTHEMARSPHEARRCFLTVGRFDFGGIVTGRPDVLTSNRHFRDVLTAKGWEVAYSEFSGGHDAVCLRNAIPEGLIHLAGSWG